MAESLKGSKIFTMNRSAREILIGLNLIPEITPRRMALLLGYFSSPQEIWSAPAKALAAIPGLATVADRIAEARSEAALDRELQLAERMGVALVTILDPDYPAILREIEAPPAVLCLRGNRSIESARSLAIVGTRRASGYGRAVARRLASDLARLGLTVVSGLAHGIDTAAHRGALDAGSNTVAVLGSGLAHPYPAANHRLMEAIAASGTVLSEYPLRARPTKWSFPQRNRIISGLCRGVIVVEAPARSGALITARLALAQGREVFAVPGPITSTASLGTNQLIKDGATLVETAQDVLAEFPDLAARLRSAPQRKKPEALSHLSPQQERIYELIGLEPLHIDDIISRANVPPAQAAHCLLTLQLEELIQEVEGRRYIRKP